MSDPERQLRKLLDRYRDRAASITLDMPELKALVERRDSGAVTEHPIAETPAVVIIAPAPEPRPIPIALNRPAPAPVPDAPRRSHANAAWLVGVLLAGLGGGVWVYTSRLRQRNSHQVQPLPMSNSLGLTRRGAILYSFDRTSARLATIDTASGEVSALSRFPNALPSGLAASPEKLWSADAKGFLYEHGVNDGYLVRRTFANPDRRPTALHWDGSHLWIADARTNSLYEYTVGASLVASRQFTLPPGVIPAGLHVEDGLLWVLDAAGLAVHRYRMRALLEPVDSMPLQPWISGPRRPTGMAVDDQFLWIATDGQMELHRFALRTLTWRSEN